MTDPEYQSAVPPDEQINPNAGPPLPGAPDPMQQQPQSDRAAVPAEPQPDAGTPNPYPQSEQPDQWTIGDVPADAPDETVQAADAESAQE